MALWTPEYIDTALWLDAADSSTITESGGAVSTWADKSGNGLDAVQATSSAQPSLLAAEINGKNAIRFDEDYFTAQSSVSVRACFLVTANIIGSNNTSFPDISYITSQATSSSYYTHIRIDSSYDQFSFDGVTNETGRLAVNGGSLSDSLKDAPTGLSTTTKLDPNIFYYQYDVARTFDQIACFTTSAVSKIDFAEFICLSSVPSDDDRQKTEGYLAHKWGLTANLPADHPYKTTVPQLYNIFGTITGADGNPAARIVRAYNRSTGVLLQDTISNASTGNYILNFGTTDEVQRIVLANETDLYNDIIDRVIPE